MRILMKAAIVLASISSVGAFAAGPAYATCPPCPPGQSCSCQNSQSPIIIDVDGSGFHLTSLAQGVRFDFYGNGHPIQMAWIAPGSTNAFLVLPHKGAVTKGSELFGNLTPQPKSAARW